MCGRASAADRPTDGKLGDVRVLGLVAMVVVLIIGGCAPAPPEPPQVAEHSVDPSFVHGTDHGDTDRLAATVVTDVQKYWAAQYPAVFGAPWRDLDGGFFSVDTNGNGAPPPCAVDVNEVEGNAYYCGTVDAIAWDRAALLPVLREHYGDASVAVVLAHEFGHAVQQRAGMDVSAEEHSIRLEAMADCYSGAFIRWVVDGRSEHLRINAEQLDSAMRAITVFRDPVSTTNTDAHGTAFDRTSAFQTGFLDGPRQCADVTETSLAAPTPDDPNMPLDDVLRADGMSDYFEDFVTQRGGRWTAPVRRDAVGCPEPTGPVAFCAPPPTVAVDRAALAEPHGSIGDQAVTTLLASRYALAALTELGRPATGAQITCLTGAYTAAQPALSPGDLDEAVEIVLESDGISRNAHGNNWLTGFDRIAAFRNGALGGTPACG
ncbi:neutral zinc metallopeptidase [Saccharopolyspora sp. K220]|uniref:neutral zinc metallopeptidase n=1 Tax=Saccharopolyspora soli TaxID=2926618 RepID=UPI001F5ACC26|nr:neutral zinc metallopeptidase [Saccharopolyspora soli]MCI2422045.1 neutral zinc metallopeptidase [Saccharopolyspora soli]